MYIYTNNIGYIPILDVNSQIVWRKKNRSHSSKDLSQAARKGLRVEDAVHHHGDFLPYQTSKMGM